jgi:hypothetical protein
VLYRFALDRDDPERELFLAITSAVYGQLFMDADGRDLLETRQVKVIVIDAEKGRIERWIG